MNAKPPVPDSPEAPRGGLSVALRNGWANALFAATMLRPVNLSAAASLRLIHGMLDARAPFSEDDLDEDLQHTLLLRDDLAERLPTGPWRDRYLARLDLLTIKIVLRQWQGLAASLPDEPFPPDLWDEKRRDAQLTLNNMISLLEMADPEGTSPLLDHARAMTDSLAGRLKPHSPPPFSGR